MSEPHAVRWYRRRVRYNPEWSRWHGTDDASFTWCGTPIPVGISGGSFSPDTDDLSYVDCVRCLRKASQT